MPQNVKWVSAICLVCKKKFQAINYRLLHGKDKYCSRACRGKSPEYKEQLVRMIEIRRQKAYAKHPRWKDGKRLCLDCENFIGIIYSRCKSCYSIARTGETKRKEFIMRKGNSTYQMMHKWIVKQLGKPKICMKCLDISKRVYDWANISGEYKTELSDWIRLCHKCHMSLDWSKNQKGSLKKIS